MGKSRNGLPGGDLNGDVMSPHEEASKMLEAALIEMDGIIAGTVRGEFDHPGPPPSPLLSIHQAAERLKLAIQQQHVLSGSFSENGNDGEGEGADDEEDDDDDVLEFGEDDSDEIEDGRNNNHGSGGRFGTRSGRRRGGTGVASASRSAAACSVAAIDSDTRQLLLAWLTSSPPPSSSSVQGTVGVSLELEARAQKLEGDKNALQFQVSLLQDQIEALQHKIQDLERALEAKRAQLSETEDALKRELNQRATLEAHKLDLMTEIGNLHLRQSRLERENLELKDKCRAAEITSLKLSAGVVGAGDVDVDLGKLNVNGSRAASGPPPPPRPPMNNLDKGVQNNLSGSRRFKGDQHQFLSLPRPGKDGAGSKTADDADGAGTGGGVEVECVLSARPPTGARRDSTPTTTSTTNNRDNQTVVVGGNQATNSGNSNADSNRNACGAGDTDWPPKDLPVRRPTTPTLDRTRERIVHPPSLAPLNVDIGFAKPRQSKGLRNIFSKMKKSSSATPATASAVVVSGSGNGDAGPPAPMMSVSMSAGEFQRGGVRATAGPRLGWTKAGSQGPEFVSQMSRNLEKPSKWSTEHVCLWLGELGLGAYVPAARNWMQTGEILLSASGSDLEKHLGVRNALHKKKILLGIEKLRRLDRAPDPVQVGRAASFSASSPSTMTGSGVRQWNRQAAAAATTDEVGDDPAARLDSTSVLRWLTDVGLAQYREHFTECRVDGQMLNQLTVEEATHCLKMTNFVHFLGLRSGIRVLREIEFDLTKLTRTVYEDGDAGQGDDSSSSSASVKSLARWTNSRLVEWLRCIDLAEFADNLKGSGVHGGLLVYEDRFNSETMATVLAIPSGKTLLRRHLSLQFASLVGKSLLQAKRDAEANRQTATLSPSTKIKVHKAQFGLIKKRNKFGEFEPLDLVCPAGTAPSSSLPSAAASPSLSHNRGGGGGDSSKDDSVSPTSLDLPETAIE